MPAEVRLNFMFTFAQGNFFFFERIFEDSSGDCDFRKLSGNSHIISFTRQYFFRLSSFFSHKLFTNIQYDRNIKRTKNYFFDRFFSYFPLSKPTSRPVSFFIASPIRSVLWDALYCFDIEILNKESIQILAMIREFLAFIALCKIIDCLTIF